MWTIQPASIEDLPAVQTLFRQYADALGVDLGFQGFETEVRDLPGDYAPPRGVLLLARDGPTALGCVAVRPLEPGIAEMKRLFVSPGARKSGLGRALAEAAIAHAAATGHRALRLDTLPQMAQAHRLYQSLGFQLIPAYRHSPIEGTSYMELALQEPGAQEHG